MMMIVISPYILSWRSPGVLVTWAFDTYYVYIYKYFI